jgi:acyl-CoA dehydrogenase
MVSFLLSEEQSLIQDTARDFAANEIRPAAREFEKAGKLPDKLLAAYQELGFPGLEWSEALGGQGLKLIEAMLVAEELARGDAGAALALGASYPALAMIDECASDEQKQKWLSPFAQPDAWNKRAALALSDSGVANEEPGFKTTAKKDGDGYLITGTKAHVVHGGLADLHVVLAQLDPAAGWEGFGAYLIEGQEGIRASERPVTLGFGEVPVHQVEFKEARAVRLAGKDGDFLTGFSRAMFRIALTNAARCVGLARAAYEYALEYAQQRVVFGKVIGHHQAIAFMLADMATLVDSARWPVWRAAWLLDKGESAHLEVGLAVSQAHEAVMKVTDDAVQILGGAGFVQDHPVEMWMRDAKTLGVYGMTTQVADGLVAAAELGRKDAGSLSPAPKLQPVVV